MLLITLAASGCAGVTAGSGTKNAATTTSTGPTITAEPGSQSIVAGKTATFSVTATGTVPMMYQWSKNGAPIGAATGASYTTPALATSDNGSQFTVAVTDATGSVTSSPAILTVTAGTVAPTITAQPSNQTMVAGQQATFTVAASGTAPIAYQWSRNGAPIGGANAASYTTPATAMTDSGSRFSVVVNNAAGSAVSGAAVLTVNPSTAAPSITSQPANQTVNAGQTGTFTVVASGSATLTYQWSKNGAPISGATGASYTTPATATSDSGAHFSAVVSNSAGSVVSGSALLTVNTANVAPSITAQPASLTVTAGQTAKFSVTASGTPAPTYQWRKNGTAMSGATASSYTTPATATSDNASQFTVVVTNSAGSVTSNAASLTVTTVPVAPSISTQPASQTVAAGQIATFSVAASGTSPFTYQWRKGGTAIGGATAASYTTPATISADNGSQFTVVVTNSTGSVTSGAATLTVNTPGALTASAGTLSFASVNIGSSPTSTLTFTNSGSVTITVSGVSISGPGFGASGIPTGTMIAPGQHATLTVTFAPSGAGAVSGNVAINSNASNSPSTITLTGTGVQPVSHSVTLSWIASTTSGVSGYNVYRATSSGAYTTPVNSSPVSGTQFTDTTVQSGQTYFYVVTSINAGVESAYSNEVSATIP